MSYIVNFERKYYHSSDYNNNDTMPLLENKYNFPIYINIKEIVSGVTNTNSQDMDGIIFLCKDNICLTSNFLDKLKYTDEHDNNRKKYYYSDYSLLKLPLRPYYDKYTYNDFKILLYPKQKLSVHIFTNSDNPGQYWYTISGWITFQVDRYPN